MGFTVFSLMLSSSSAGSAGLCTKLLGCVIPAVTCPEALGSPGAGAVVVISSCSPPGPSPESSHHLSSSYICNRSGQFPLGADLPFSAHL